MVSLFVSLCIHDAALELQPLRCMLEHGRMWHGCASSCACVSDVAAVKKKFVVVLVVGAVRRVDPMVRAHEGKEIGRAARTLGLLHSHSHARSAASADVVSAPVSLWLERSLKTSYCKSRNPHSWPRNGSVLGINYLTKCAITEPITRIFSQCAPCHFSQPAPTVTGERSGAASI